MCVRVHVCVRACVRARVCVLEREERKRQRNRVSIFHDIILTYKSETIFQYLILKSFRMGNKLLNKFEDGAICVAIQSHIAQKGEHSRMGCSIFEHINIMFCLWMVNLASWKRKCFVYLISQVHNFQKLKNISLEAVNFFSNKNKSNLFE